MDKKEINVTKTFLPDRKCFENELNEIWERGWLTNSGVLEERLTTALREFLDVNHLEIVANGTLALQLAIKALDLKGEIITTPFTYVATATSIAWEGCVPVFVDIDEDSLCINPELIESSITDKTSAILSTHVYGYPCDTGRIQEIAEKHNLKVVYDAAHCFGEKLDRRSILDFGDISTLSFHATKLFHCAEGGAVICRDKNVAYRVEIMKRFGHTGEDLYEDIGINAKMSELHAAMGLCVLPHVTRNIARRKEIVELYEGLLGNRLVRPKKPSNLTYNYGYFPVIFPSHESMLKVRQALREERINPRRYFYPSINTLPYFQFDGKVSCPVSESIAMRVLCLPLFESLSENDVSSIVRIVLEKI